MDPEPGKDVAGEERFDKPDLAAQRLFLEADPRTEDIHSFQALQVRRGDVLALWFGLNAIPQGVFV
jgi:hypothetical protein